MLGTEVEPGGLPQEEQNEYVRAVMDFLESAGRRMPQETLSEEIKDALRIFVVDLVRNGAPRIDLGQMGSYMDRMETIGELAGFLAKVKEAIYQQREAVRSDDEDDNSLVLAERVKDHLEPVLEMLKRRGALEQVLHDPRGDINSRSIQLGLAMIYRKGLWPPINAALGLTLMYFLRGQLDDSLDKTVGDEFIFAIASLGAFFYLLSCAKELVRDIKKKGKKWRKELPVRDVLDQLNTKISVLLREHTDITIEDVLEIQRMVTRARLLKTSEPNLEKAEQLCHDFDELARSIGHNKPQAI